MSFVDIFQLVFLSIVFIIGVGGIVYVVWLDKKD